jgi:phosphate transport system substrate-binding protein
MKKYFLLYCFAGFLLASCTGNSGKTAQDTPTSGSISVAVDESLRPLLEAEVDVFESTYDKAELRVSYTSEAEAIRLLLADSARLAIVTRQLSEEETAALKSQSFTPRYIDIAYDGVTFILHKDNKDSVFTPEQLKDMLLGNTDSWDKLGTGSDLGKINFVFDNGQSGAIRYLKDSLLNGSGLGKNCFAVNTNPDVISYVEKNPNSIGIIGCSWISDRDDTLSQSFLSSVRIAGIVPYDPETAEAPVMKPYQAFIALKQYPFWRKVTVISREARTGLGTGFASFLASDVGQRIVLKAGMVPATAPVRIINSK